MCHQRLDMPVFTTELRRQDAVGSRITAEDRLHLKRPRQTAENSTEYSKSETKRASVTIRSAQGAIFNGAERRAVYPR